MKHFLKHIVAPWLSAFLIGLLFRSLRFTITDPEGMLSKKPEGPILFAFWHNRLLLMGPFYRRFFRGRLGTVMISRSRDGEFMSRAIGHFGIEAARGSTSKKGNLAVREVIRKISEHGYDAALTPDGPRGPRYIVQPGILQIAQRTGRPILPVTYHLSHKKELRSWDRFQIPYPFSRIDLIIGKRIPVPPDVSEEEMKKIGLQLAEALGV